MATGTTFGVLVGTRGFFNPALAGEGRRQLLARLEELGYQYVILPEEATPTRAVETLEDARKCAALFADHADEIDGIVVALPNFGDEQGIVNTLDMADLDVPVLVQASDDEVGSLDVENRRDSFCGKLSVCNNLYQYGIPFTDTTYHTCAIGDEVFTHDLEFFASVCRVVGGLRGARVGAIGARPAPFQTVRVSEKILQANDITVITVDLSEILAAARAVDEEAEAVQDKITELNDYGQVPDSVPPETVARQARLSVALDEWVAENEIDAAAIQCWSSLQENYGCAACVSMSMLSNKLIPCACEVDVSGAVSMLALALAAGSPAALLDWNNNYGDDRDMCICTHCSAYPRDFIQNEIEISHLDVLGATLGKEVCFGAVKGRVAAGPMTYFRVTSDDTEGILKAYAGAGEFTDDPADIAGGVAVCRVPELQMLMKLMCQEGFEHHVAMVRSDCSQVVAEAVGKYLDWALYLHA
ncbi:MAG: fucose isomerase [Candidatus Brocadiia bacterium]